MLELRPYQVEGVDRFLSTPKPHRYFLAWDMGAGKTYAALAAIDRLKPERVLFIVPAIVRPNWHRLACSVFPGREIGAITMGRSTKSGTNKALAARDAAYAAAWQVVSYDLVGQVNQSNWDLIIIDEIHNLRNPLSVQSKDVREIFQGSRDAHALGLSGTLIPNEAKQIWNPLDMFFPGAYGEPSKTRDVSWSFLGKYCHKEVNAYGTRFYGLREDARDRLKAEVDKVSHRVVTADFASYLPPLFVEPLYTDAKDRVRLAMDWATQVSEEVASFGVFTHLRETATLAHAALSKRFPGTLCVLITGEMTSEQRDTTLKQCRDASRMIVIGTTHALNEGVSLSFLKAAMIVEFVTELSQVMQFIGRFARQDSTSTAPTRVDIAVGPNDEARLSSLRERLSAFNSIFKAGRAEGLAENAFKEREMTAAEFDAELSAILSGVEKRTATRGLISDDEEDDDTDE